MKAIILAAGYATRLYPLTKNQPKALLPIGNKPIIDYIVEEIETIKEVDKIIVISNDRFYNHFVDWSSNRDFKVPVKIINDHTTSDDDKLGAIGDINLVLNEEKIEDDVLIVAGDNYFTFKLKDFYDYYKAVDKDCILVKELNDKKTLQSFAVVVLDEKSKVIDMEEKPQEPKSNIGAYASYIYKKETLPLIKTYLEDGNNPDAPGHFPAWLYSRQDIYAYAFEGECYDIGTPKSYEEVQQSVVKQEVAASKIENPFS